MTSHEPRDPDREDDVERPRLSGFMIAMIVLFFVALAAAVLSAFYRNEREAAKGPMSLPASIEQPGEEPPPAPAKMQ